jgi:cytochrome c oxidase subunit 1
LISSGVFGFIPTGVSSGWTLYPPLSLTSGNSSLDFLIVSLHLNGISSLLNAVNTIVTVQFCSSVSLWHLSLFVWSLLITSYLIILVVPVLVACITALLTDDVLGTCFFSVLGGGDPVLFQHLFWFFGHPEVYIVILPAFGLVSEILGEYCSYRLIGYKVMVWSMLSIAFLGCLVWGHHMYTVGMEVDTKCYFTLATSLIAIPTGLKVLLWVASFLNSDVKFNVPITFSIFFIITFVFGGLTGIWLAQAGLDLLLHDTYFVVAHFHYVMAVSLVYMFFAAVYNWYHFITGLYYNETCARIHLVSFVLGSNLLFMPMHFLGLSGMPRRIFDYPSCFWFWNQCSTFGFFLVYISLFWFMLSLSPLLSFFFFNAPRRLLSRYGFLKFFKAD